MLEKMDIVPLQFVEEVALWKSYFANISSVPKDSKWSWTLQAQMYLIYVPLGTNGLQISLLLPLRWLVCWIIKVWGFSIWYNGEIEIFVKKKKKKKKKKNKKKKLNKTKKQKIKNKNFF